MQYCFLSSKYTKHYLPVVLSPILFTIKLLSHHWESFTISSLPNKTISIMYLRLWCRFLNSKNGNYQVWLWIIVEAILAQEILFFITRISFKMFISLTLSTFVFFAQYLLSVNFAGLQQTTTTSKVSPNIEIENIK